MEKEFYDGLTMAIRCGKKIALHVCTLALSSHLLAVATFILTAGSDNRLLNTEVPVKKSFYY